MLQVLRERFHPLHWLRRQRFIASCVLPHLDRPVAIRMAGIPWRVHVRLLRNLAYVLDSRAIEPGPRAMMETLIPQCGPRRFWDVGANIGYYAWLFLARAPAGEALLLEPDPDNLELLKRTLAGACLDRAVCLPVAASDRSGRVEFHRDLVTGATGAIAGAHRPFVTRNFGLAAPSIQVPAVRLDDLARRHPPPDLVKIDVEGAELAVLRGARALLARHRPVVLYEAIVENAAAARDFFSALGYVVLPTRGPGFAFGDSVDFVALPPALAGRRAKIEAAWTARVQAA